jgi:putative phosphoesterase
MALIGLISDVHATPEPVADALSIFAKAGVDQVLCAGDIAGYMDQLEQTITLLVDADCQTIMGNHDLLYLDHHEDEPDNKVLAYLKQLPASYETVIEDNSLYMVHAQPPDGCHGGIKLLNKNAEVQMEKVEQWSKKLHDFNYDVLVVGHTHQVFAEFMGGTLVVNPGSSAFNNSCAILRLPELTVEVFALCDKQIEKTWNWGQHVIYGK